MVPRPDSPDVDRRPVFLSGFAASVARGGESGVPGRREHAVLCELDRRRNVDVLSVDVGRRHTARGMNRYSNILPYDRNRVVLRRPVDDCDYVNASWIRPAAVAPTPGTAGVDNQFLSLRRHSSFKLPKTTKPIFIAAQGRVTIVLSNYN